MECCAACSWPSLLLNIMARSVGVAHMTVSGFRSKSRHRDVNRLCNSRGKRTFYGRSLFTCR
jgi:hypothetical protein